MGIFTAITCAWVGFLPFVPVVLQDEKADRPANVVLIVSDDAGYADFSLNGSTHFPTPHIDSIAKNGVRFNQGYVSASVCSPSRAGLLTGRYQQRFGHHLNLPPKYSETNGLPLEESTLADALKARGYQTIALGKWHLGYAPKFHPLSRGFDDYYGFLQGARSYTPLKNGNKLNRLLRDREPVEEEFEYMTDSLGEEAAKYIDQHAGVPFFMYLCFNAVHTPLQATQEKLEAVEKDLPEKRRTLAAMTVSLDDAVGDVLAALERNGLTRNTIVVFINDNGGQTRSGCLNTPLRGRKGQAYEGGIRVPFVGQWPGHWPAAMVYDHPVSALDLFPTALVAAGGEASAQERPLDGVDLTPYLVSKVESPPHQTLYWQRRENFAVRDGDWKLVRMKGGALELYDIAQDPSEARDLADDHPDVVVRLQGLYDVWKTTHEAPRW